MWGKERPNSEAAILLVFPFTLGIISGQVVID
jgi:hypothetical protein